MSDDFKNSSLYRGPTPKGALTPGFFVLPFISGPISVGIVFDEGIPETLETFILEKKEIKNFLSSFLNQENLMLLTREIQRILLELTNNKYLYRDPFDDKKWIFREG